MLQSWIESTVDFCIRYSRSVILAGLILAAASAVYAGRHFAINTDINDLLSARLPWRQHEIDFQRAFPQTVELIIADVRAPTPEAVKAAARELEIALADKPGLFHSVADQFDSPFFRRNGLLYLPPERIEHFTEPLAKAKPLVAGLVTDPSLRGLLRVLGQLLLSTQQDLLPFDDLQRPLSAAATTLEDLAKGEPAEFSWRILSQGDPKPLELHRFVQVWPVLDHNALEPGGRATAAIRDIVTQTGIEQKFGADVSLTGPVVISDNEFSGVHEGIVLNSVVTGAIILAILWLALRSLRLVAAAVINLTVGLLVTSAGGILMVGALNPIFSSSVSALILRFNTPSAIAPNGMTRTTSAARLSAPPTGWVFRSRSRPVLRRRASCPSPPRLTLDWRSLALLPASAWWSRTRRA